MKKWAVWFALSALTILSSPAAQAYEARTTHPALTQEIIEYFNASFPQHALTPEERSWVIEGSTAEDTPPRWINHFYDPLSGEGWVGEKAGSAPSAAVQALSLFGLSTETPHSAVDWMNNYLAQDSFSSFGGNRTWKRGLEYYAAGDRKEAYKTLGHVLHLLEDLGVPDHTRNDTHAHAASSITGDEGSPYEDYAGKWIQTTITQLNIPGQLKGTLPPTFYSPKEYLVEMAEYSNTYFFSKDSVSDEKYEFPEFDSDGCANFCYGVDDEGKEFPLVGRDPVLTEAGVRYMYSIKSINEHHPILDAYFSRLSKKIVFYGAGLVNSFIKDAQDELVNKDFPNELVKFDATKVNAPTFSLVGTLAKIPPALASAFESVKSLFANMTNAVMDFFAQRDPSATTLTNSNLANLAAVFDAAIRQMSPISPMSPMSLICPISPMSPMSLMCLISPIRPMSLMRPMRRIQTSSAIFRPVTS